MGSTGVMKQRTYKSAVLPSSGQIVSTSGAAIRRSWRFEPIPARTTLRAMEEVSANFSASVLVESKIGGEEFLSMNERNVRARRRVEAILLICREPLTSRKIAALATLEDATQARTLIHQLNELYQQESYAFQIEEQAGGYVLVSRPQFARWLRGLSHISSPIRLGLPALETLTIIAYRQPIMRAYIESVRGSASDEVLRQLQERDLIRITGRSEDLGRPYLYGTTKQFLQIFGLRSLEHLPKKEWVMRTDAQFANSASHDSIAQLESIPDAETFH